MKSRDLLLEIGLEEIPARFVRLAEKELKEQVLKWLKHQRIDHSSVKTFSTPRRLAVLISEVYEKQRDEETETRGPARSIAVDEHGAWSKAAVGFARGQGVSTDDLFFKDVQGKTYVFARRFIAGKPTMELLPHLEKAIRSMSFPQSMRWNGYRLKFIRPIQWIVALYGKEVIPFEITGVKSGRKTDGHRFLGRQIEIEKPAEYEQKLRKVAVICNPEQRRKLICEQLKNAEQEKGMIVVEDQDLLEEVTQLVEYPTVFFGTFDKSFLELPRPVLRTTMREHQRYFTVQDGDGNLLPSFAAVRNGDERNLEAVVRGNEKVLHARLQDARFFYEEDQKKSIAECCEKLDAIVFQENLGTVGDRVKRIVGLAMHIARSLPLEGRKLSDVKRAAEICKFDLVTNMVDEFSELQGVMGEIYARNSGENETVARTVRQHYLPKFKGDHLPEDDVAAVVATADKLDLLTGCFTVGMVPTGSQDPYGLRRAAMGLVEILTAKKWPLSLEEMVYEALRLLEEAGLLHGGQEKIFSEIISFVKGRIETYLQEKQIRYDIIHAVLAGEIGAVDYTVEKAECLAQKLDEETFPTLIEALSRPANIAKKAQEVKGEVSPALFQKEEEHLLYQKWQDVSESVQAASAEKDAEKAYQALTQLVCPIHAYFEQVMVMDKDPEIKENRLRLMYQLTETARSFADFGKIVL